MKGKKAVKAAKSAAKSDTAKAFVGGAKDGFKAQARGVKAVAVPALVAGSVAGKVAANKDKKMEKKAASMATKRLLVKARKGAKSTASKAFEGAKKVAGDQPANAALGAAIGGSAMYAGAKKNERDVAARQRARKASK